jgi:hypothetical protein
VSDPAIPGALFRRPDESRDAEFYRLPRFVNHIDPPAIAAVTRVYRQYFPAGGAVLDLMSSWVSHLPEDVPYRRVAGLGMNAEELAENPRLTEWTVHDLNREPTLPYASGSFDGVAICASIQYLTRPIELFTELARVLLRGAPLIVSFSNRCFPTKAVAAWRMLDDHGHVELVRRYFGLAGTWRDIEALDCSPGGGDPLFVVIGRAAGSPQSS